jgi:sigma-B regulation protein RsbU (phosphoserine phosphatase)
MNRVSDGAAVQSELLTAREGLAERSPAPAPGSAEPEAPVRRLPSLRWLIILIVVLPIAAVAGALVTISILTSRNIAEQLGRELVQNASDRVATEVKEYIGQAVRVSDLYTRRIEGGRLSTSDLASWEPAMFEDLGSHPDVASICFSNTDGDATYLDRTHGRLELGIAKGLPDTNANRSQASAAPATRNANDPINAIEWPADANGHVDREHPIRKYFYDARARPWYQAALRHDQPVWTPVYFWFGDVGTDQETGTGYTRLIRRNGTAVGVLTIDVTLSAISDFLRRQPFSQSGAIFILDDQGLLVAASEGRVNSPGGQRLKLSQSNSPSARAVAQFYRARDAGRAREGEKESHPLEVVSVERLKVDGQPARVSQIALQPYQGMNWSIISVLPESAFLSQAKSMQQRSIVFGLLAILLATGLGVVFSRRLSQPLLQLTAHAARIGRGDFGARLHLGGARELHQLAEETNRMAGGLKQRMELEQSMALATHVQQCLLPKECPSIAGLDIAAHSRYCDSTGGDYFDFIDVSGLPGDRAFVAVGDVMGHGIGSALVMATARAAVRASAVAHENMLGALMERVNNVLSSDPHGLFMTLALVIIEPQRSQVRWASAGHDPVIAYDPGGDRFIELDGGDIPLGISSGYSYQAFSQTGIGVGWILFIGTDGVWEAREESMTEMYGKQRLRDCIRANSGKSAQAIADAIEASLAKFVGRAPVLDDITFVIVRVVPDEAHAIPPEPERLAAI